MSQGITVGFDRSRYRRTTTRPRKFYVSLVKTYMLERGIGVGWFCKQTNTRPEAFSKIENGKRQPPGSWRAAASMALGERESELFIAIEMADSSNIAIVRDPSEPRRILEVGVREIVGGEETIRRVWSLDDAPWVNPRR